MGLLREALSRLEEQGLVRSESQHGYRVTPLSPQDLRELTDARCEIETLVLRDAAELYRCWSDSLGEDPDRDIAAEHREILDAAVGREADRAADHLARHIRRTAAALEARPAR